MNDARLVHLVDDDEAIRHSASFMLRHAGFRVKTYPDGVLIVGSPGKVIRELTEAEIAGLLGSAAHYVHNAQRYQTQLQPA